MADTPVITVTALCLLDDPNRALAGGGVWTAGSAMGLALQRRLEEHAGLRFSIEE